MAARDARSTTASNNRLLIDTTGLQAWTATAEQVRVELRQQATAMTAAELETAAWLGNALEDRARMHMAGQDTTVITDLINQASSV
jgi:hypothetical protein